MSNQHLKMQEKMYSEIEYHLSRLYDETLQSFTYDNEPLTKFNFEEFASDDKVITTLFEKIKDTVWHMYEVHFGEFQMLSEEAEYFDEFADKYLHDILEEDIQELRQSELPY